MEKRGVENSNYLITKKYPLRGYNLSVLMHTTPCHRHWGGYEILDWNLIYMAWLCLVQYHDLQSSTLPHLMDPRSIFKGGPEDKFFTHNTYQATFIIDISADWHYIIYVQKMEQTKTEGKRTDKQKYEQTWKFIKLFRYLKGHYSHYTH